MPQLTRRDFLNGVAWLGASSLLQPLEALASATDLAGYPPALTGLRGAHPGAFEAAHALAWGGVREFGQLAAPAETYDLVVIGAGLSGLSAAYFYRQHIQRDARILILDNHDDFGGHAKRNEFTLDGQTYLSYGGTQSFDSPSGYSKQAAGLLSSLGIDLDKLEAAYDRQFFQRLGLSCGVYFDAASFGKAALLRSSLPTMHSPAFYSRQWVPGLQVAPAFASVLAQAPLSAAQRTSLREVLAVSPKAAAYFKGAPGKKRFRQQNYLHFLRTVYGIKDEALLKLLSMPLAENAALGGSGISLPTALEGGLLGLPPARQMAAWMGDESLLPEDDDDEEAYVYHFPDGNATLARLLVQKLIPRVASFAGPEQCLTARFDYGQLDQADQPVRIRLSSTAVLADNSGGGAIVRYLREGKLHEARARHVVMAGWHMMAAHLIPSLPAPQKAAMRANIKMPLVYAQVALRRWPAIQKSGVVAAYCPAAYFQFVQPDFPVTLGAYTALRQPDSPMILLMIRMPCPPLGEGSVPDLLRQGRAELLATDFATFEAQIRAQLTAMYGPFGFNAEQDIAAITVNRWPHGYVYEEAEYRGQPAHVLASRRHGQIVMANADAAGSAYTDAAIDMAWRAVQELKGR